jgi:chromosome segregation ATPase
MHILDLFCKPIFILANKIVTTCRSEQERKQLYASFSRHFGTVHENERKAQEYERIMSEKEKLFEAVNAVKTESAEMQNELSEFEQYIDRIEEENETLRSVIALICQLRFDEEFEKLDNVILMLSNQYLRDVK